MRPYDIISKLIGPIFAVGETDADEMRLKNLIETIDLVEELIDDIYLASAARDRPEHSMAEIGKRAYVGLASLREFIPEAVAERRADEA